MRGDLIALWPSDMRQAQVLLAGLDGVLEVQTYGDQLRLFVDDEVQTRVRIKTTLSAAQIDILEMRSTRPRMEEAFISLVQRRRAEEEHAEVVT